MGRGSGSGREAALRGLLDAVVVSRLDDWLEAQPTGSDEDYDDQLRILATVLSSRWSDAVELGRRLGEPDPDDSSARWLHLASVAWAAAGDPGPAAGECLQVWQGPVLPDPDDVLERFASYVAVEAAMAHARLDLAAEIVDRLGHRMWDPFGHPYDAVVVACRARLLAFRGDIAAARAVIEEAGSGRGDTPGTLLTATECLVLGNDADPAQVRRLSDTVDRLVPEPLDHLGSGAHMLAAYGLIAIGEVGDAVRRLLVAGRDEDLSALNVIDRALGLELLVSLAVAEANLDDAEVWRDRALPLLTSPIADSTVARILARVALLADRTDEAKMWAERAVLRATEAHRIIEAVDGELLLSRARIGSREPGDRADAVRALEAVVAEAERRGHRGVRRSAARELRPLGQRLRPLSGSGWSGLTDRETEVGLAVRDGATNGEIATRLHLSEHTVRAHVSRVLTAFGVAGRSGLPAAMGVPADADRLAGLTPRQAEVAELIGDGLSNQAIARSLGLSPRTVEKHVGDILMRWGLPSRTAVARAVAGHRA